MVQEKTLPQDLGGRAQFCISCFKTLLTCRTLNTNTKNMGEGIFLMPIFFYIVVDEIVPCVVKVTNGHFSLWTKINLLHFIPIAWK
jgi:hypothetical protein